MIIVKLKGGLGNQMFQYALGRNVSLRRETTLGLDKLLLDQPFRQKVTGTTVRSYELEEFSVKMQFAGFREKILSAPVKEIPFDIKANLKKIEGTKGNLCLDGYWQSEEYFKDIRPILLKDFTLKKKTNNFLKLEKLVSKTNSVSVHFRRGDYAKRTITRKYHGVLGLDYYRKTIELIGEKVKNPHFFVFSDDPPWVKRNFKIKQPTTYISGLHQLTNPEELILMSSCSHNIIANSSFSWWAAWLNRNPQKIVIAPRNWFRAVKTNPGIIPQDWIKVL